jgi:hypothetical protein
LLQSLDGFPDGRTVHTELLTQDSLGRKAIARLERTSQDEPAELFEDRGREALTLNFTELHQATVPATYPTVYWFDQMMSQNS